MNGLYEQQLKPLYEIDKDILRLFRESRKYRKTYQVGLDMGSKWKWDAIRASLKRLKERGLLVELRIHARMFVYGLPEYEKEGLKYHEKKRKNH